MLALNLHGDSYDADRWRLYDMTTDFAHVHNLAGQHTDLLKRLQQRWWERARANDVLPLDDRTLVELLHARNPQGLLNQEWIVLRPRQGHVPFASAVTGSNRAMLATAWLDGYMAGTDGAVLASGTSTSGYVLYVLQGRLASNTISSATGRA